MAPYAAHLRMSLMGASYKRREVKTPSPKRGWRRALELSKVFWGHKMVGMNANKFNLGAGPILMGIVNITPDSFSDGNLYLDPTAAVEQSRNLARNGARMLDLGAEASSFFRPGVAAVDGETQCRRLLPVVERVAAEMPEVWVSIDTRLAAVARAAVRAGADVVNDISAGTYDPVMLAVVAELGCPMILMHLGEAFPQTPDADAADVVGEVCRDLERRRDAATAAGIAAERIWLDPGIGFGKTMADNWRLVEGLNRLRALGQRVVLGASRKRFLATEPPATMGEGLAFYRSQLEPHANEATHERDVASAALTAWAERACPGLIHRVHEVRLHQMALGFRGR